jgi:hypothetical protein
MAKSPSAGIFRPGRDRKRGGEEWVSPAQGWQMKRLATIHSDTQYEYYLQVSFVAILASPSA